MEPRQIRKELDKVLKEISKKEIEKGKLSNQMNKIGMDLLCLYNTKTQIERKLMRP